MTIEKTLVRVRKRRYVLPLVTMVMTCMALSLVLGWRFIPPTDALEDTVHASDLAFYVGHPNPLWYIENTMLRDVDKIADAVRDNFSSVKSFTDDALGDLKAWAEKNVNDGEMDIIWLNGCMPSILYPTPNLQPDGSLAERWLDNGNMFINFADWFGFCNYETGIYAGNGSAGAENILDLPGIIVSYPFGDDTPIEMTAAGRQYLPSIGSTMTTDRPVLRGAVVAPWEIAEVFGEGSDNRDWLDPVVLHNTETDGYIAFINQAFIRHSVDRAQATIEFINNWVIGYAKLISSPAVLVSIEAAQTVNKGDSFSAAINVADVNDLAGFQFDVAFDPAILEAVGVEEGTFLSNSGETYWLEPQIDNNAGMITNIGCAKISEGGIDGTGTLAVVTFKAIGAGESYIRLQNVNLSDANAVLISANILDASITVEEYPPWDVNKDGVVNIVDIVLVGQSFGESIPAPPDPNPDVNGDGVVNIQDIVLVGQHFGETYPPGAPPGDLWAIDPQHLPVLAMMYNFMERNPDSEPGFLATRELIHRLMGSIRVSRTELLQNYPNPFNPDTYIPYQLAEDSYVSIKIYSSSGQLVRIIDLGHRAAGVYVTRDDATHWDGINDSGEHVASGIYYYTIQTDQYTATKKMMVVQ